MGRMAAQNQKSSVFHFLRSSVLAFFDSCILRFLRRPTGLRCIVRSAQRSSTLGFFDLCVFGSCVLRFLSSSFLETPDGVRVHAAHGAQSPEILGSSVFAFLDSYILEVLVSLVLPFLISCIFECS